MAETTNISWTDSTFNPWIGCTKVSTAATGGGGCDNCYAEALMDHRMHRVQWGPKGERSRTSKSNWAQPLRWERAHEAFFAEHGRRRRVFCASLADVFDNAVPVEWRRDLFNLILSTPNLDWLLLTKRIGNAARMIEEVLPDNMKALPADHALAWPWPHVWLGASIVNQEEVDRDIPKLLAVPARVRFLSCEPLLGPINFEGLFANPGQSNDGTNALEALDWVIVGGESGANARPMFPHWAASLRDQCEAAGVPFFFKQWGDSGAAGDPDLPKRGDWLYGRQHHEWPRSCA